MLYKKKSRGREKQRKTPDASRRNDASLSPCVCYRNFRKRKVCLSLSLHGC